MKDQTVLHKYKQLKWFQRNCAQLENNFAFKGNLFVSVIGSGYVDAGVVGCNIISL